MPFRLVNAPIAFLTVVNEVLKEHLENFALIYLENILIYSKNKQEHMKHLQIILNKYRQYKLYRNLEIGASQRSGIPGTLVSEEGLKVDPKKINHHLLAHTDNVDKSNIFLGFTGGYRGFIKDKTKSES
jgi:hypothetical protein